MEQDSFVDSRTSKPLNGSLLIDVAGTVAKCCEPDMRGHAHLSLEAPAFVPLLDVLSTAISARETSNMWRGFDKSDVLRLILQTIDEMGYREVVELLERASGVQLFQPDVRMLQQSVLGGKWHEAGKALLCLSLSQVARQGCWFLLMQHKFLETIVDCGSSLETKIACLRKDLSPAAFDPPTTERVHECASLLMYQGSELMARALKISSLCRSHLFSRLTCLMPASVAMQPSRLATLLSHAHRFQVLCCPMHVESHGFCRESLIEPHRCKIPVFPQHCVGCLHAHQKEVWTVAVAPKINHKETLVASGAADKSVSVWLLTAEDAASGAPSSETALPDLVARGTVPLSPSPPCENSCGSATADVWEASPRHSVGSKWAAAYLDMHVNQTQSLTLLEKGKVVGTCKLVWRTLCLSPAAFLDWDSTGKLLAAGSENASVEAWEDGRRIGDYRAHSGLLVALQWVPGSRRLISLGADRTMALVSVQQSNLTLTQIIEYEWLLPARPQEGLLLPGGESIIVFFADRQVKVFDLVTKQETFWVQGKDLVVAACASKLCNQILMSTASFPPVLRLWDLDERKVVQKYRGHKLSRLTVRPAFGGPAEEFVISGSEDAQIYIWHRLWGCMLQQLNGHAAAVNQVAWLHSCGSLCLVSAGDDGVLLLWSSPATASNEPADKEETKALPSGDDK